MLKLSKKRAYVDKKSCKNQDISTLDDLCILKSDSTLIQDTQDPPGRVQYAKVRPKSVQKLNSFWSWKSLFKGGSFFK